MKENIFAHITAWNWRVRVPDVLGRVLIGVPISGTLKTLPTGLTLLKVRDLFILSVIARSLIVPESSSLTTWTYLLDRPVSARDESVLLRSLRGGRR